MTITERDALRTHAKVTDVADIIVTAIDDDKEFGPVLLALMRVAAHMLAGSAHSVSRRRENLEDVVDSLRADFEDNLSKRGEALN
jgi:hypothetical protein